MNALKWNLVTYALLENQLYAEMYAEIRQTELTFSKNYSEASTQRTARHIAENLHFPITPFAA